MRTGSASTSRVGASPQRPAADTMHYSFALTCLAPASSSAKASLYSSSSCLRYIFAVCGRFIFSLLTESAQILRSGRMVEYSRRRQKLILNRKRINHQITIPDPLIPSELVLSSNFLELFHYLFSYFNVSASSS